MKYSRVKFKAHLIDLEPFVIFIDHASLRLATPFTTDGSFVIIFKIRGEVLAEYI